MGAKTFFLRNGARITYAEFSACLQRLSFEKRSPSLRWLSAEVSWHSGSAQNRFCNFFGKHSAMVLKNLFVSSSDVRATNGAILSREALANAREARGDFLDREFRSLSCVNQAIRLLLRLWNGKFFFRRTTLIRETRDTKGCHLEGSINKTRRLAMLSKTISRRSW